MQFFKNCVVDQQEDELKMKMTECVEYRRQILANPPEPIHKMFGFYFVDPELVNMFLFYLFFFVQNKISILIFQYQILFDFELLFDGIDSNALINIWPEIKNMPQQIYNIALDNDFQVPTHDPDVMCFLHLLKWLPSRNTKFQNAVKAFAKFVEVNYCYQILF